MPTNGHDDKPKILGATVDSEKTRVKASVNGKNGFKPKGQPSLTELLTWGSEGDKGDIFDSIFYSPQDMIEAIPRWNVRREDIPYICQIVAKQFQAATGDPHLLDVMVLRLRLQQAVDGFTWKMGAQMVNGAAQSEVKRGFLGRVKDIFFGGNDA